MSSKQGLETKRRISNKAKKKRYGKNQAGIGNSNRGHAFSEFRKLKTINEYKKYKRKQHITPESLCKVIDEIEKDKQKINRGKRNKPNNKYQRAWKKYEEDKTEKERLKQEMKDARQKRREDLKQKEEKRMETNRKLNERTKRGQPIMANHIKCLLEKIERG